MMEWLKGEKLPNTSAAAEMLMDEAEFIKFYNMVWKKRGEHMKGMSKGNKLLYDAI